MTNDHSKADKWLLSELLLDVIAAFVLKLCCIAVSRPEEAPALDWGGVEG